jgi:hypothetical protein
MKERKQAIKTMIYPNKNIVAQHQLEQCREEGKESTLLKKPFRRKI